MAQTVIADDAVDTDEYSVGLDALGRVRISPTDVSQFIRLDQCERYLRLRLHERSAGIRFMHDYGVVPQSIPPLLTRSGEQFEERVERTVAAGFRTINLALTDEFDSPDSRPTDNERVVAEARARDASGALQILIADIKSSTAAKVEHRLQVAFYAEMVTALLVEAGIAVDPNEDQMKLGILYRGPTDDARPATASDRERQEQGRA